jgi:hypothetical protein
MKRIIYLIIIVLFASCTGTKKLKSSHENANLPLTDTVTTVTVDSPAHDIPVVLSYLTVGEDVDMMSPIIHVENRSIYTQPVLKKQMGLITYSFPDTLKWDEYGTIELRITKNKNTTDFVLKNDNVVVDSIRVSNTMKVNIIDIEHAFEIEQLTSDIQAVEDGNEFTMWKWTVKPAKAGKHKLEIVIQIITDGVPKNIPVVTYEIYVQSQGVIKKLTNNLEDKVDWTKIVSVIITGGIIPLIIFLWKRRKKKKTKQ